MTRGYKERYHVSRQPYNRCWKPLDAVSGCFHSTGMAVLCTSHKSFLAQRCSFGQVKRRSHCLDKGDWFYCGISTAISIATSHYTIFRLPFLTSLAPFVCWLPMHDSWEGWNIASDSVQRARRRSLQSRAYAGGGKMLRTWRYAEFVLVKCPAVSTGSYSILWAQILH